MKTTSLIQRRRRDRIFKYLIIIVSILACMPLIAIMAQVVIKGVSHLSTTFFLRNSMDGGIANGITGTLMMTFMAALIAIPVGVLGGIYLSENRKSRIAGCVRFVTELLQGIPSILIGVIVYVGIVIPMKGYSMISGGIALSIMMIPLIVRSTEETLKLLPVSLKEASLALGAPYRRVVVKVLLPSAFSGITTGILLAVSRVIGETAPLMLTALGASRIQWDITRPGSAISLLIWEFYNNPAQQSMIWSAALFLMMLVLGLNLTAKSLTKTIR